MSAEDQFDLLTNRSSDDYYDRTREASALSVIVLVAIEELVDEFVVFLGFGRSGQNERSGFEDTNRVFFVSAQTTVSS